MDNPKFAPGNNTELDRRVSVGNRFTLIGTGAVLTAFLVAGCAPNVEAKPNVPEPDPDTTSQIDNTPSPEATEPTTSGDFIAEGPELSLETDPETLSKQVVNEVLTNWINAGATDDIFDAKFEANASWEEFLPVYVSSYTDAFAKKYISSENTPETEATINTFKAINYNTVDVYRMTARNTENPENIEGYRLEWIVTGEPTVLSQDENSITIEVPAERRNNSDLNELPPIDDPTIRVQFTLVNEGGAAKISDAKFFLN